MIGIVLFTLMLLIFGSVVITMGVSALLERYKDGPSYRSPSYPFGIFVSFMGLFLLVLGIWFPFAAIDSEEKHQVFTEQCHSKGGSVVELESDYECWKERIEL